MTAQHAERQGKLVGHNIAASLGHGTSRRYKHHDLGFVVELGAGTPWRTVWRANAVPLETAAPERPHGP